jgi:hypothetical protein
MLVNERSVEVIKTRSKVGPTHYLNQNTVEIMAFLRSSSTYDSFWTIEDFLKWKLPFSPHKLEGRMQNRSKPVCELLTLTRNCGLHRNCILRYIHYVFTSYFKQNVMASKQLVIGGVGKVYEIGKQFRNEGGVFSETKM